MHQIRLQPGLRSGPHWEAYRQKPTLLIPTTTDDRESATD